MFLQVSVCPQGGACVVAPGGACVVAPGGACMVALGGHAWLLRGVCVVAPGGACMVAPRGGMRGCSGGGMRGFFNKMRSMSGQYASYWNAFLFDLFFFCKITLAELD